MDIHLGDILRMKKGHPCGGNEWEVQRIGMDFRLLCKRCGRTIMIPRKQAEKNIKLVFRDGAAIKPSELVKKPVADAKEAFPGDPAEAFSEENEGNSGKVHENGETTSAT